MGCSKNKVINRLALVLISIMVLELVLIGDQVQPVKAIKKKMLAKKLKKLLPLLALIKPKKKVILLPIPIPMFSGGHGGAPSTSHHHYPPGTQHQLRPSGFAVPPNMRPQFVAGGPFGPSPGSPMSPPMSFMMMTDGGPPVDSNADTPYGSSSNGDLEPMFTAMMAPSMMAPAASGAGAAAGGTNPQAPASPVAMAMPSMTMTIQSEPGGGSNIELSTSMGSGGGLANSSGNGNGTGSASGALVGPPPPPPASVLRQLKWRPPPAPAPAQQAPAHSQQLQQLQQVQLPVEQFLEGGGGQSSPGDDYYSSPWSHAAARWPPLPRHHHRQQQHQHQQQQAGRQWHPAGAGQAARQQRGEQVLLAVGPPQLLPVYQTANGQLHMAPPPLGRPASSQGELEEAPLADEVQTVGAGEQHQATPRPPPAQQQSEPVKTASGRLTSPAHRAKQQMDSFGMMDGSFDMPMQEMQDYSMSSSSYGGSGGGGYSGGSDANPTPLRSAA